mgnify:CR=1 FL=1
MNKILGRYATSLIAFTILALQPLALEAGSFGLTAGGSVDGDLYRLIGEDITIKAGGEKVTNPLSAFDAGSQEAIRSWASENPHMVDVYTKWDAQPVIKSSSMPSLPDSLNAPGFKGMVSVDLVLNEKGQVIFAKVNKTTHEGLGDPSLAAAKTWRFSPAKVGGKAVKAKLRVPFKFTGS